MSSQSGQHLACEVRGAAEHSFWMFQCYSDADMEYRAAGRELTSMFDAPPRHMDRAGGVRDPDLVCCEVSCRVIDIEQMEPSTIESYTLS